ncbi:CgeB family protein [Anaeromyxobacter diazotrophicus]|uniref:Glycosyl transferase n=1 Tax=Anaeromyxobacter diazotrophicus TaxID=2590199 RepID=A0A7I9VPG4_9BACT|nr:glycosyltransferase [Anaeromyxobacter diazotrophicus]GEJ58306.1 glycosyl transferase [Anaeromyxobacter diazotrophicus]
MRLVVFGLTISSSWGNGHATLWRGLARSLARRGHHLTFFERDVPYYAAARDLTALPGGALWLYAAWGDALPAARRALAEADCAMVTSYCPDGAAAAELVLESRAPVRAFYDLDTPVTLDRARRGEAVDYIGPRGLGGYDLVLSFTGGAALSELARAFGARRVVPLYGSVDPEVHRPTAAAPAFRADLSYLGTYAPSRQAALEQLFVEPARRRPERTFVLGGAQYGRDFPWRDNIRYVRHLPPSDHPAFYCSSPLTVNVTRGPMAAMGYCPSGRLFEAAACGTPVLSDAWEGLSAFFEPGREILVARDTEEALAAVDLPPGELARVGRAARARVLAQHTAERRAAELVAAIEGAGRAG